MATLPYMNQLPQDYYTKNYIPLTPVVEPVVPPIPLPPIEPSVIITERPAQGATWYGSKPPTQPPPPFGALWLNPANNGLYIYTNPGVWTQIGTNW